MENIIQYITDINNVINDFVWVKIGLFLLIGSGILTFMRARSKFFCPCSSFGILYSLYSRLSAKSCSISQTRFSSCVIDIDSFL